jgi:hypothetical protein
MRKVYGGVVKDVETQSEVYFVSILNENGTVTNLFRESFSRKKAYGKEFVIETANLSLAEANLPILTREENNWYLAADSVELQELIIAEDSI